jgi:hypothetical protein
VADGQIVLLNYIGSGESTFMECDPTLRSYADDIIDCCEPFGEPQNLLEETTFEAI